MDLNVFFGVGFSATGGILKHLVVLTFVLQTLGFAGLVGLVIYEFLRTTEAGKREKNKGKTGAAVESISEDNLPRLAPINCRHCGAGVPLRANEMTCPNCGAKTSAPENYFDVACARGEINEKIRAAAVYLERARFISSNWIRYATALLAAWLAFSFAAALVLINKGNFKPYQTYLSANALLKAFSALGSFSNWFWVISLFFGFVVWSPRLKKALPQIELNENVGKAEIADCPQCGGAIRYQPDDLAAVCGYCGVETYRTRLAWKLRNLTNDADRKATFSLVEARAAVEDAVGEITGTPKVFAFLLILGATFAAIAWLIHAGYDRLPPGVKEIFEFVGDIFGAF
ncbi:MAG TPA: hypothetical protein VF599_20745 [Pyrinomonadaceae bacterium]|jgi:hypothetical protein